MTRILISLSILSLLAACEAPTAPATEETPTPTAAAEKAPEAKPSAEKAPATTAIAEKAPATTAIAATNKAPSACGGEAKGKNCANPDCVYGDDKKAGPGSECPHELDEKATAQAPTSAANHFGATFALIANQPLSKSLATKAETAFSIRAVASASTRWASSSSGDSCTTWRRESTASA